MVLKFKVWRLQKEKEWRYSKETGPLGTCRGKYSITVWRLRDKNGHIRRVARTEAEIFVLKKWFETYNVQKRLDQLIAVRRLKEHVRRIKQNVRKRGFIKQLSIYGITKNIDTGKRVYRRYEIFKAEKWTRQEVAAIHDFFKKSPPLSHAGIFIYHQDRLLIVDGDRITQKGTDQVGYKGERRNLDVD